MNFEFLKDLKGLNHVYENCHNAEKLAITMPAQSVFTSRKGAELIARFIYMAAHNQQMQEMRFVDILNDMAVKRFINNSRIISAFHRIRKNGNQAAHFDDTQTTDDAIDVLRDLHFVSGEIACILGLIRNYPDFNCLIESDSSARFVEESEVKKKALEMFLEYTKNYDAKSERDHYYNHRLDLLRTEFEQSFTPFEIVPAHVKLNESLEFKSKHWSQETLAMIQNHFGALAMQAVKKLRGESDDKVEFAGKLTIYGKKGYETTDLAGFIYGILYDLPDNDGFKIETMYTGKSISPLYKGIIPVDFEDWIVPALCAEEDTVYKFYKFRYNCGESFMAKYVNGSWVNPEEDYYSDIIDKDFGQVWMNPNMELSVEFDFDKHKDIIEALHTAVKKYIPETEIGLCEDCWDNGYPGLIVGMIEWSPRKLQVIRDFLDALNSIMAPIFPEIKGASKRPLYITTPPFAVAEIQWTPRGFKLTGTEL